jgi:hypothetical protein
MADMLKKYLRNKQYLRQGVRLRDTDADFMDGEVGILINGDGDYSDELTIAKLNDGDITIPSQPYVCAMAFHDTEERADVGLTEKVTIIRAPHHPIWTKMYKDPDAGSYAGGDPLGITWDTSRPREEGSLADTDNYGVLCPAAEEMTETTYGIVWFWGVVMVPPSSTTDYMLVEFQMIPSSYYVAEEIL